MEEQRSQTGQIFQVLRHLLDPIVRGVYHLEPVPVFGQLIVERGELVLINEQPGEFGEVAEGLVQVAQFVPAQMQALHGGRDTVRVYLL